MVEGFQGGQDAGIFHVYGLFCFQGGAHGGFGCCFQETHSLLRCLPLPPGFTAASTGWHHCKSEHKRVSCSCIWNPVLLAVLPSQWDSEEWIAVKATIFCLLKCMVGAWHRCLRWQSCPGWTHSNYKGLHNYYLKIQTTALEQNTTNVHCGFKRGLGRVS